MTHFYFTFGSNNYYGNKFAYGDPETITSWLIWFLQTMEDAIVTAQAHVQRIVKKTLFWQKHVSTPLNERQVKIINRLWDGIEGKLNTSKWAKMTHTSSATALRDIQDLLQKRCPSQHRRGRKKYKLYISGRITSSPFDKIPKKTIYPNRYTGLRLLCWRQVLQ